MKMAKNLHIIIFGLVIFCTLPHLSTQAAVLTHGPMIGHTTDTTTRIWVRADGPCEMHVRMTAKTGGETIVSEKIRLVKDNNFCGSARVKGLAPASFYSYRVFLDNKEQPSPMRQEFKTFPRPKESGVVRIGFGHSVRGPGDQTTWKAIEAKKPDLFILMGDNIYSDSTEPAKQRKMHLQYRADPYFRPFAACTPIYAVWDDHDYGKNNSDRTQPGKERSLKTFNEIWPNPPSQAVRVPGIWTRFRVGQAELFLLDGRYHRSPNSDPDGPKKTMLGAEQLNWLKASLADSTATFKFPVAGSSWNCGGPESWNHSFKYEYDALIKHIANKRIANIILLGGDQHLCKIAVRSRESWGGYDLHEWMAGQLWNTKRERDRGYYRAFGLITINTSEKPATARLEYFDHLGNSHQGRRILYTTLGSLRCLLDSPSGVTGVSKKNLGYIDRLRPWTSGPLWEVMPETTGETLTENDLGWPNGK